jgi:hypothetical protein
MSGTTTTTATPDTTTPTQPIVDSLRSPQFLIANEVMLLVAFVVFMVFRRDDGALINTVVGLIVGSGFGGVVGFYLASSVSSQRKDGVTLAAPGATTTTTTTPPATVTTVTPPAT